MKSNKKNPKASKPAKDPKKRTQVACDLPEDLYDRMKAIADAEGRPLAQLARIYLKKVLDEQMVATSN